MLEGKIPKGKRIVLEKGASVRLSDREWTMTEEYDVTVLISTEKSTLVEIEDLGRSGWCDHSYLREPEEFETTEQRENHVEKGIRAVTFSGNKYPQIHKAIAAAESANQYPLVHSEYPWIDYILKIRANFRRE